jgi:hypothetical protein
MAREIDGTRIKHTHESVGQGQVAAANRAVGQSFESLGQQMGSVFGRGGTAAIAANQALELAQKIASLGPAAADAAKAGAVARDVARSFAALGDAVPAIEALQAAVAGTVDETTLQQFALLGEEMGLTAEASTGLAQRITLLAEEQGRLGDVSELLARAQKSPMEAFKELGVLIDVNAEQYKGLSEAQRAQVILQEQSALATQEQVDALDSAQASILRVETKLADMTSQAQAAFSEWLEGSGVIDLVSAALNGAAKFIEENASLFETMGDIIVKVGGIIGRLIVPALERMAFWLEAGLVVLEPFIDGINLLLDGVDALDEIIPDLNDVASDLFVTDLPTFATNTAAMRVEVDSWAESMRDLVKDMRDAEKQAQETAREVEAIRTRQFDDQAMRVRRIALAFEEAQALDKVVDANANIEQAVDQLVDAYGDEEGALDALNQRLDAVDSGARAAQSSLQKTTDPAMIERFRNQRDELNQTAADIRTLSAALSDQIDVRDSITTTVDKETTSIKFNTEAREENIEAAWGQIEANNAWAEGLSAAAMLIGDSLSALREFGTEEGPLPIIAQGMDTQAIAAANLTEQNLALAESMDAVGDSFASVVADSDTQLGKFLDGTGKTTKALGAMVKGIDAAGDSTASSVSAIAGASASIAGEVFDSTTAQMGLFAVDETAKGFRDLAAGSPVTAGLHWLSAGIFATGAALSFAGGGGRAVSTGGAGAGPAGGAGPAFGTAFDQAPSAVEQEGPGTTVFIQLGTVDTEEAGPKLLNILNDTNRTGSGFKLDSGIIEGA